MRNELHEMSKRMNELNLKIKGLKKEIEDFKADEAAATNQVDKDLYALQVKQISGKMALYKTALKLMDLEFKKAVRGGDYDFTIDFMSAAAQQLNQEMKKSSGNLEPAAAAADPKPINEMTLTELEDEIVELQCKQMADEWDDNAPEFTYQDWRRLLALRAAYYEITDELGE